MSAWPGKFVIGLTGNIATGKSVVRRMLEHAGAFGIDADALSHRAIEQNGPGYAAVVQSFGKYILKADGEIDRKKLGQIVFSDPQALKLLEGIIHPIVREGVAHLARLSPHQVIVIEAIKLLESPLREACDVIWVVTADEAVQLARLKQKRGMDLDEARKRMANQSSQAEKAAQADTVIDNSASIEQTWQQVKDAWRKLFPQATGETLPTRLRGAVTAGLANGMQVMRARPRQAEDIAGFINANNGTGKLQPSQVVNAFGEKAFLLLHTLDGLKALLGWKVENLVARVDDFYLERGLLHGEYVPFLVSEVEQASRELQCEVILLFVAPALAAQRDLWLGLGYEERLPSELSVGAWQEAAQESATTGSVMLFKQLRADRVLRPI
ncbi:MAG: dephospho-CoA kinase [Anaerolineales bacterium]|nr:MAG: dephospho-CoA kinase [Anaerolineales bacterium]